MGGYQHITINAQSVYNIFFSFSGIYYLLNRYVANPMFSPLLDGHVFRMLCTDTNIIGGSSFRMFATGVLALPKALLHYWYSQQSGAIQYYSEGDDITLRRISYSGKLPTL